MGDRLAHREERLVVVELAPEERADDVGRGLRLAAHVLELAEPQAVVLLELRDPLAHAAERQSVRRQHQRVGGGGRDEPSQALQEAPQRVGVGIDLVDADVGGDARQQHVARDHHADLRAVERGVLRRMAVAHDHAPAPAADRELVAVHHAPVGEREIGRRAPVDVAALHQHFQPLAGKAVAREVRDQRTDRVPGGLVAPRVRDDEVALGHDERRVEPRHQPPGIARVVGMEMRRDDAAHPPAGEEAVECRCHSSRGRVGREPESTITSRSPSSSSQRLMWLSANGSGMRSQCTPGATSRVSPGCGGAACG
jgi:hypothetical protein